MNIGSLFSGYGGLEMGVQAVLGSTVAWHSEIDPSACKILAHRYPDVPNLGDITAVDWAAVEPVDVLTGGSPCQDVSAAGKRLGMRAGTRSGLWASMCDAIDIIRPGLVVWENVRGVLSAGADSAVEPCPICVGDERDSHLRALGRVVGDLAELGYVGRWTGLRAADVGAPHGRFRVFVAAWPAADDAGERPSDAIGAVGSETPGRVRGHDRSDYSGRQIDPDPTELRRRPSGRDDRVRAARLVTGAAADTDGDGLGRLEELHAAAEAGHGAGDRDDADGLAVAAGGVDWGPYGPAIHRWERCLGRPAPSPTERGRNGQPRLSSIFVEFLMGLPAGWVTDVPGLGRNGQLKALGNGVVPQQAAAALRMLLTDARAAA